MWYIYKHKSDVSHVTIYWLPSNGAIIQCSRKAHAIKAGQTSRVQQLFLSCLLVEGHWGGLIARGEVEVARVVYGTCWSQHV